MIFLILLTAILIFVIISIVLYWDHFTAQPIYKILAIIFVSILIFIFVFFGIKYWNLRTNYIIDSEGIVIQEVYLGRFYGKPKKYLFSEILRFYSNVNTKFPTSFLVYEREGKKNIIGLVKSDIENYNDMLNLLSKYITIFDEPSMIYAEVKFTEFKRDQLELYK